MKIGLLGCGSLGCALVEGWLSFGPEIDLTIYDHNPQQACRILSKHGARDRVKVVDTIEECLLRSEILVLCVKPRDGALLVDKLKTYFAHNDPARIVISAVSGLTIAFLRARLRECSLFRVMPNLAVQVGASYIGLYGTNNCVKRAGSDVEQLFSTLGHCVWTHEEDHLDAIMAISSCGLAFISTLLEAWADAGVAMGLTAPQSLQAACQTLTGVVKLLGSCDKHPGSLKWEVTSPAGATVAGLHHLERAGIRGIWMDAMLVARQRFLVPSGDSRDGMKDVAGGSYDFQTQR